MNIGDIFLQLYYNGILAFSIALLAIAIIIHAQVKHAGKKQK